MTTDEVIKAYEVAKKAHEGQTRWGGEPYITHPMAVSEKVDTNGQKAVALLHDVVEDTDVTLDDLYELGFTKETIRAIDALTHREGEEYFEYIGRIANNVTAIVVKLADLEHNLSTLDNKKHRGMKNKYMLARMFLEQRLHNIIDL